MTDARHAARLLDLSIPIIEAEVAARLERCGPGRPGFTDTLLSNGHGEVVYRTEGGEPIAALGYCLNVIEDYCVAQKARRLGVARLLADHVRRVHGCNTIAGPFTRDGLAFARSWMNTKE